jgi:hypothetical protein
MTKLQCPCTPEYIPEKDIPPEKTPDWLSLFKNIPEGQALVLGSEYRLVTIRGKLNYFKRTDRGLCDYKVVSDENGTIYVIHPSDKNKVISEENQA